MAIKQERPELEDNLLFEENLSTEGIDSEFLAYLKESQNKFEGCLDKVRGRREKSVSLLDEVREDLGRSQSWLKSISVKE